MYVLDRLLAVHLVFPTDASQSQETGTDDDELYVSNPIRVVGTTLHAGLTL